MNPIITTVVWSATMIAAQGFGGHRMTISVIGEDEGECSSNGLKAVWADPKLKSDS